jgi:hypothetical protein
MTGEGRAVPHFLWRSRPELIPQSLSQLACTSVMEEAAALKMMAAVSSERPYFPIDSDARAAQEHAVPWKWTMDKRISIAGCIAKTKIEYYFGNPIPIYLPVISMMPSNYSHHLSIFQAGLMLTTWT